MLLKKDLLKKFGYMCLFSLGFCLAPEGLAAQQETGTELQDAQTAFLSETLDQMASAWKGHKDFAEWLVENTSPKQVVDLGVDYGYSTFVLAKAAQNIPEAVVTGIDLFEGEGMTGVRDTYDFVMSIKEQAGLDNLEIIKGEFTEVSQGWNQEIDILHIDGYHSYEAVSTDFKNWSPFVKEDGIIIFHDINVDNPAFGVKQFFKELSREDGYKLYFLHSYGLGIYTKNKELKDKILANFSNVYNFDKAPF